MLKGNKGEWSELYVFLKLLGDGGIYAADGDLSKIDSLYYPLIEVLRKENHDTEKRYTYNKSASIIKVIDGETNKTLLELPQTEFKQKAEILLSVMRKSKGAFGVTEIEKFMHTIFCNSLKAPSKEKRDISVVLHDNDTFKNELFGFSIKSKIGSPSTLFNAGKTTNFIYEIKGNLSQEDINYINSISTTSKFIDRVNFIYEKGCSLKFVQAENKIFQSNLKVIDTALPEILSLLLVCFYKIKSSSVVELTKCVNGLNPCSYDLANGHPFYEYKIKNFLTDVALGMQASTVWEGKYDATGGYIVVRKDGEIVCYHFYRRNEFQDYLFKNTKLETPSSTKYEFGSIYSENSKNYIKLNLQVRFI